MLSLVSLIILTTTSFFVNQSGIVSGKSEAVLGLWRMIWAGQGPKKIEAGWDLRFI